ncbi:MAG: hypothetical protein M1820_002164 [Bogoriella megaspora]|nr:MAG: hypothetical protein M1820_002164 [Bogoriella megaspora]
MDCMRNQFTEGALLNGRFETVSPLNHGSFGMVFMAKDHLTDDTVAIKCLTKPSAAKGCPAGINVDDRSEELAIHTRIGAHPNIVNLIDQFETDSHYFLVLEFCPNGDLYEAIRLGRGPLVTDHVRDFMIQLVDSVEFIHSKGVAHRDIKPENILLTQSGSMKLGDFGLATSDDWSYESAVGSDRHMAPEQHESTGTGYSPAKADIWAIGICLLNVLFSRNPFSKPTTSDPLYADFATDKQTLFDVFPNMSQDTFEILIHCLAIDPSSRSLSLVRDAIKRVVSFTTDEEALDEFCTEEREVVPATANREPLRTPSITSPNLDNGGAFPWAQALRQSPQKPVRQMSTIADSEGYTEDLFPGSDRPSSDDFSIKADSISIASIVDSGLGVSLKSIDVPKTLGRNQPLEFTPSQPKPISGSLPNKPFGAMSSVFGNSSAMVSKSWSELWDEEEEEQELAREQTTILDRVKSHVSNHVRKLSVTSESTGRSTPRGGLTEVKNPSTVHNSRNRSPPSWRPVGNNLIDHPGFLFDEEVKTALPRYSPTSKRSTNFMDKWSALGDRRRGTAPDITAPEPKRNKMGGRNWKPSFTLFGKGVLHDDKDDNGVTGQQRKSAQEWSLNRDWRRKGPKTSSPPQRKRQEGDDIGDLEWVGVDKFGQENLKFAGWALLLFTTTLLRFMQDTCIIRGAIEGRA